MYYVGNVFDTEGGGYKTIQQAKKQAEKKNMKVFDENGAQVYPEPETAAVSADLPQNEAEKEETKENTKEQEKAAETAQDAPKVAGVELTDDVPEGALEETPDGGAYTYNEAGERTGTVNKSELEKMQEAAGALFEKGVIGTIKVVRSGMIALRNAPKWEPGHKCGVAKTGYEARTVGRFETAGGTFYKLENGCYISGREGDTVFTPDKE